MLLLAISAISTSTLLSKAKADVEYTSDVCNSITEPKRCPPGDPHWISLQENARIKSNNCWMRYEKYNSMCLPSSAENRMLDEVFIEGFDNAAMTAVQNEQLRKEVGFTIINSELQKKNIPQLDPNQYISAFEMYQRTMINASELPTAQMLKQILINNSVHDIAEEQQRQQLAIMQSILNGLTSNGSSLQRTNATTGAALQAVLSNGGGQTIYLITPLNNRGSASIIFNVEKRETPALNLNLLKTK